VKKTEWSVSVEGGIAQAITTYGEEAVYHCFILGASQQFYRHINNLTIKLGTTKAKKKFEADGFQPSAPVKKMPGAKALEKLSPEDRIKWAAQVQEDAMTEINEGVEEKDLLAYSSSGAGQPPSEED